MAMATTLILLLSSTATTTILLSSPFLPFTSAAASTTNPCRSFCGNITIAYPFATKYGCGHPAFKDLLFCINDILMIHIASGSYRVLEIDYPYRSLTLHDPHLSTCDSIVLGAKGNGFVVDPFQEPYLTPDPDNVFFLIGCSPQSPLFEGFPSRSHLTCRNVSGMGCEDYYRCPAWRFVAPKASSASASSSSSIYGSGPPECCAVSFQAIRSVNLTKLGCQGYSSAYALAPLRLDGPHSWSYGIRVRYSLQENDAFCKACEGTGGTCGYGGGGGGGGDGPGGKEMCLCGEWNSTSTCDTDGAELSSSSSSGRWSPPTLDWYLSVALVLTAIHVRGAE